MDVGEVSLGGDNGSISDSPPPVGNQESDDLSLASPFLNEVAPDHRSIVAPYIKKWDAGVTKKFQDYSTKLKNYEKFGDPTQLERYVNFGRNFERDPETAFRLMWQGMQNQFGDNFDAELLRILQMEEAMSEGYEEEYDPGTEEYDPNAEFQQNVSAELEELRAWREETVAAQQSAEENKQLDSVLQAMHTKYGEFDNNWILVRLAEHGNVDQAIKEWKAMLGKYSQNGASRQAPKVMGGQGGVPSGQIDAKSLRGKDRRDIVAAMLEQAG